MTNQRRLYLLWPIGVSFLAGIAVIVWAEDLKASGSHALFSDVILELGMGLFIGGVLASTVEFYFRWQKDAEDAKHLHEIETKIFYALFGTALPDPVVKMMYDVLFAPRFVRRSLTIKIKLRELTAVEAQRDPKDAASLLVLNQVVTYNAHNISRGDAIHKVSPQEFILVPHMQFPQPFRAFTATPFGGSAVVTDVQKCSELDPDNVRYRLKTTEIRIPEGDKVGVVSEVELVCRDTDMRTWLTYYPADDLKLCVELSPALAGQFQLAVDQSHHDDLEVDRETTDNRLKFGWKLSRPVLPYQGVVLFWRRKPPQPQQRSPLSAPPQPAGV